MKVDEKVFVIPLDETGVVKKIRMDERGEPLIDVVIDSDGKTHVCRECELWENLMCDYHKAKKSNSN